MCRQHRLLSPDSMAQYKCFIIIVVVIIIIIIIIYPRKNEGGKKLRKVERGLKLLLLL